MKRSPSPRNTKNFRATIPAGETCSTRAPTRNSCTGWRGWMFRPPATCARRAQPPASMRWNARWTSSPSRSRSIRCELRLQCYSDRDQGEELPYTSKQLRECYRQGAAAFGWDKRNPEPRSMRDGSELVGWGMATGVWEALQMPATVRIVLTANGHAEVATAASDIGTGTYTIMAQIAADMLGLPLDNISVKLGDSTLPQCPLEGGSWMAATVSQCDCDHRRRGTQGAVALWRAACQTRSLPARSRTT